MLQRRRAVLHGHEVSYTEAGSGPLVVMLHGIAGSARTWDAVTPLLASSAHVLAPDLLGHGESAKPRGDYSLGAYASGLRDLLELLGHDRATIVGHSLGGGVAMQFAYQFPERCERLVLVSSGGLGREVTPLLRAATLPGSEWVLPLIANSRIRSAGAAVRRFLRDGPLHRWAVAAPSLFPSLQEIARGYASLAETSTRSAFVHTARSVMDFGGQRVDARDRLYLAAGLPTLILWGERDSFIPSAHGRRAAGLIPGCRLEVFERAGHFPHLDEPGRFAATLAAFLADTEPGRLGADLLRARLLAHTQPANIPEPIGGSR